MFALLALALLAPLAAADRRIDHVVLLILENRSFDNVLGQLYKLNPEVAGLTGNESCPVDPADPDSERVYVHDEQRKVIAVSPGHKTSAFGTQIYGEWPLPDPLPEVAPMNGFIKDYLERNGDPVDVMGSFKPEVLPVFFELAQEFAVFDHWFHSIIAPTQPNRFYIHAGTSDGFCQNDKPALARGMTQRSMYEMLDDAGYSFRNYFQEVPSLLLFKQFRRPRYLDNFAHYSKFKEDAAAGALPNLSFIDPRYATLGQRWPQNDFHPGNSRDNIVSEGEILIKDIYETLRASPAWNNTAFIITFDEAGGFYDHIPSPSGVPNPDGKVCPNTDFTQMGVRIPTVVVSPRVPKGTVMHTPTEGPFADSQFEASSIPATLRKLFEIEEEPLTARAAWAGTFEDLFTARVRTDCPETMPEVPMVSTQAFLDPFTTPITDLQQDFVALASGLTAESDDEITTGEGWTEGDAALFMREQVCRFFGRCMYEGEDSYDGAYCAGPSAVV